MLIYIVPGSIIWFALSVLAGIVASKKADRGGYFFLSLFLSPLIGLLAAALLPAIEKGAKTRPA
jgi:membrane protein DedA with SNARE-associated domain